MTSLALPSLTQGNVTVLNADVYCHFGCTATVKPATIMDVSAPLLVGGDIDVRYTTSLKTVSLPSLTTTTMFRISNNPALTRITAPKLASATTLFDLSNDSLLPTCQATTLLAQVTPPPATVDTSGDLTSGACL